MYGYYTYDDAEMARLIAPSSCQCGDSERWPSSVLVKRSQADRFILALTGEMPTESTPDSGLRIDVDVERELLECRMLLRRIFEVN
jgi:hypothetical protein